MQILLFGVYITPLTIIRIEKLRFISYWSDVADQYTSGKPVYLCEAQWGPCINVIQCLKSVDGPHDSCSSQE